MEFEELDRDLKEATKLFSLKNNEERAYIVMKTFFHMTDNAGDDESDEEGKERTYRMFTEWLLSHENQEAKDKALERVFNESINESIKNLETAIGANEKESEIVGKREMQLNFVKN